MFVFYFKADFVQYEDQKAAQKDEQLCK